MSGKKAIQRLIGFLAGVLVCIALLVFCVDPFYHYHDAWFGLPVVLENAVYQTPCCNAGIANRGASWVAIALVIFLLLIICCCCCGTFKNNCM